VIIIPNSSNSKNTITQGFGRNEFEALRTALLNFIEFLLQEEKYIDEIKESLKIFLKLVRSLVLYNMSNR